MSGGGTDFRPASMGFSARAGAAAAAVEPSYDEQIGMTFTQDFTTLTYNVTALAQAEAIEDAERASLPSPALGYPKV